MKKIFKILMAVSLLLATGVAATMDAQTPKKKTGRTPKMTLVKNGVATPIKESDFDKINKDSIAGVTVDGDSIIIYMKPTEKPSPKK
ncbi:MAG: hypothetical protein NC336_07715 [Clostridium sp.]|nr:hypothetical protein [Clostridium sp.]